MYWPRCSLSCKRTRRSNCYSLCRSRSSFSLRSDWSFYTHYSSIPLFELLWLHRYCHCLGEFDARATAGEFRSAFLGILFHRLLDPMAHDALEVAQNLCLQSAVGRTDETVPLGRSG